MIFEPDLPGTRVLSELLSPRISPAHAATDAAAPATAPAAPPAMDATLPDVGMTGRSPGAPSPTVAPGAVPGVAAQGTPEPPAALERALPAIGQNPQGRASANGTSPSLSRDALARRQEDLARKEQDLKALEGEISAKLEKLQVLENRLSIMIKEAEETKDAKFRHLVDVLTNMKAKQAAAVLETLDQKIAVRVLAGMRGRQAGEILTFVHPEKAALLTEALARMQLPLE